MDYENSLKDKTIIVTGANCGIGYEAALDFAKRGGRVILACRSQAKADEACEKIKTASKNPNVEVEILDLSSLRSTREFAERILAKLDRLDILVNNAGISGIPFIKTEEGFEMHWVTNYLGHYLLTRLLLDLLKKSTPSRIVNVSSKAHEMYGMNWDDLMFEKNYKMLGGYSQSKLAQIMFTVELAKRLKDTGVTVVSLHPGVVATEIWRSRQEASTLMRFMYALSRPLVKIFAVSSADGAKTTIHCATHPEVANQSGSYYDCNSKVTEPTYKNPIDRDSIEKLWNLSEIMAGL